MGDMEWFAQELMNERYQQTVEALNRCAKAGADIEAIKTLARESGVDIRDTILGDEIRPRAMGQ